MWNQKHVKAIACLSTEKKAEDLPRNTALIASF